MMGTNSSSFLYVGQKHGRRITLPCLDGVDANLLLIVEDVQQDLGCFPDTGDGFEGMPASQDGKIGHRVQLEQVGTGDDKEVADHQVRCPGIEQIGQAVKDVEYVPPFLADDIMDLGGKGFEADIGVELVDDDLFARSL